MSFQLFLEALDVWLFRDGRPFFGGGARAESLFPPYPTVLQGAIRSHQLTRRGIKLYDKASIVQTVGTATNYGTLRMRGPFLARRTANGSVERLFPQPADALSTNHAHNEIQRSNAPTPIPDNVRSSCPTDYLIGMHDALQKGQSGLWLSETQLQGYLAGHPILAIPQSELFSRENRYGTAIAPQKNTTRKSMLYEIEFTRPNPQVGLLVEISGKDYEDWPEQGLMAIGGEGRAARFERVKAIPWPSLPANLPERFKLYFATPTFFEQGWQPGNWQKFFTGPVELKAAAIARFETRGGFDMAASPDKQHRPGRRFVPAGSIYYFESKTNVSLRPDLEQQAITDFGAEIGFGQTIQKEW